MATSVSAFAWQVAYYTQRVFALCVAAVLVAYTSLSAKN